MYMYITPVNLNITCIYMQVMFRFTGVMYIYTPTCVHVRTCIYMYTHKAHVHVNVHLHLLVDRSSGVFNQIMVKPPITHKKTWSIPIF